MKVAFATPEFQSLVRRTSLAELAESLPRTLMHQGLDVLVFLPWTIDVEDVRVMGLREVAEYSVRDVAGPAKIKLHRGHVNELQVVLVDHPLFRERHPYGDDGGPYLDNWRRYALFARAVLEGVAQIDFTPDVFHCMDWTSGLLPLLKKLEIKKGHPAYKAGTLFAVQNLAMQGHFEREVLPKIGVPAEYFRFTEGIELGGRVNFLKAGAEFATLVCASSPTMATRLTELNRGDGFEDTFQRREGELVGIRAGIDYRAWDPSTDPLLAQTFSSEQADPTVGKRKCKATLQEGLKLDVGPRTPVVAIITRFDSDGGFDVLAEALTPTLERNVELVMMGPGAPEILERIRTLEQTFAGRCRLIENYDVNTAHTILAGSDALLLPGHYHASTALCAIALRYGVAPIAYAHSGLEDVIRAVREGEGDAEGEGEEDGTGFLFDAYTPESLVEGIDEMRGAFKKAGDWKKLVKRCMAQDFSWQETGREYEKAYRRVGRLESGAEKRKRPVARKRPKRALPPPVGGEDTSPKHHFGVKPADPPPEPKPVAKAAAPSGTTKKAASKKAAKKTSTKKAADADAAPAQEAASEKASSQKSTQKPTQKPTQKAATSKGTAAKKPASKKAAAKKAASKKPAAKKAAAKQPAAKKKTVKKAASKKPAAKKKATSKKTASKKTATKKPASKKKATRKKK